MNEKQDRNKFLSLSNSLQNLLFPPGKYNAQQLLNLTSTFHGNLTLQSYKELMTKTLEMPNQERLWWVIKTQYGEVDAKVLLVVLMLQLFGREKRQHEGFNEASKNLQAHSSNSPRSKSSRALYVNNEQLLIQNYIKQNIQIFLRLLSNQSSKNQDPALSAQQLQPISILFRNQRSKLLASNLPVFSGNQKVKCSVIAEYMAPKIHILEQEVVSFQGLRFSVIIKEDQSTRGKDVKIIGSSDSEIYIDAPIKSLYIIGCGNCNIYVAACQKIAYVDKCEKVSITITSNLLRIANTIDSFIYTYSPSPTILTGQNRSLVLGPNNSTSKNLKNHMKYANIPISNSYLNQFQNVISRSENVSYEIMKPCDFDILVLPLKQNQDQHAKSVNSVLLTPQAYIKELEQRNLYYNSVKNNLSKLGLNQDMSKQLHSSIQGHFKDWLISKGYNKNLIDLVKMIDKK